jgi:serine/threonine protein kinase
VIGKTLGPYRILEPLGAGGMGEVFLGEDTRLGRKVAIKVLPTEFASDPGRLARFEQEARAAAALNHPHIAVVHDVGAETDQDGATIHFMVQEYLRGETLRDRLDRGALPLDEALDLAVEIGEALSAAHAAGIVHRDLKPDNVFVTEQGHAKVLDFGLAKLTEVAAPSASAISMSPTMLGTVAGQVMGTAGYMAPEQSSVASACCR